MKQTGYFLTPLDDTIHETEKLLKALKAALEWEGTFFAYYEEQKPFLQSYFEDSVKFATVNMEKLENALNIEKCDLILKDNILGNDSFSATLKNSENFDTGLFRKARQ